MGIPFKKILVASPRLDQRMIVRDSLKEIGCTGVQDVPSLAEGISICASGEVPDWIVCAMELDQRANAFQLLNIMLNNQDFRNTRLSLLVHGDKEASCVPVAFDLGVLSYHTTPFTKTDLQTAFGKLFADIERYQNNWPVISAQFLRRYLTEKQHYEELLRLEERLMSWANIHPELFVHFAKAQTLAGQREEAVKTLIQAKHLQLDLKQEIGEIENLLKDEVEKNKNKMSFAQTFNLKTCLVVDSDQTAANSCVAALKELGFETVEVFEDGLTVVEWIKNHGAPDLVLQEWRLRGLSGPALLQRLRSGACASTPVIVVSSLVSHADANLLREFGASNLIKKPLAGPVVASAVMAAVRDNRFPQELKAIDEQLRQAILGRNLQRAKLMLTKLQGMSDVPKAKICLAQAEVAFLEGQYINCRNLGLIALQLSGESSAVLHLLGKALLKLGDKDNAFRFFSRADALNPQNIERLCMMAQISSEDAPPDEAEILIERASTLDKANQMVQETKAAVHINREETEQAKEILAELPNISNVISYMNSRAVSLVMAGKVTDAVVAYKNAIAAIPEQMENEKAAVGYNIALAYVKLERLSEALNMLAGIRIAEQSELGLKVKALQHKVKTAIKSKTPVQLNVGERQSQVNSTSGLPVAFYANPGDLCLHMIFSAQSFLTDEISKSLEKPIPFHRSRTAAIPMSKAV